MNSIKFNLFAFWLFLSLCFFCSCRKSADSTDLPSESTTSRSTAARGEQIVDAYLKEDASEFRKSRLRFTITSENEPAEIYEVDVWRKQTENEILTLSHIVKPSEDSDLSSLARQIKDEEPTLTSYVKSSAQFRETKGNKSFFGGIPAEELLGEWSKYDFSYVGEKTLNGVNASEVEGKLKTGKRLIAARMIGFFRTDNNLLAELHLFGSDGKELRAFRIKDYQAAGGRNYASKMEIENLINKTRVLVEVLSMDFPKQIDDSVFTREQLKKNAGE